VVPKGEKEEDEGMGMSGKLLVEINKVTFKVLSRCLK